MSLVRAFICVYLHTNHAGDSKKRAFIPLSEQGARLYLTNVRQERERERISHTTCQQSHLSSPVSVHLSWLKPFLERNSIARRVSHKQLATRRLHSNSFV
jgi:hypothetical protein